MRRVVAMLAVLLIPAVAGAQSSAPTPAAPSHPSLPWSLGPAIPVGQLLRDVWVPPQTIVVDTLVPMPAEPGVEEAGTAEGGGSAPQYGTLRQTVVVPGYWVRQTTSGDYYPQRWMLEQTAPGTFQWRLLPAEVRAR